MRRHYNVKCRSFIQLSIISFQHNPRATDAFASSWQEFKLPVAKWLFLSQFVIDIAVYSSDEQTQCSGFISNCDPSVFRNQSLHSRYVQVRPWCGWPAGAIISDTRSFSNTLHHFLTRSSLITPTSHMSINWGWISIGHTCFAHTNQITPWTA